MRRIKHVLTERQYAWEDAVKLAKTDPEIDLSGKGPLYQPAEFYEDPVAEEVLAGDQAVGSLEKPDMSALGSESQPDSKAQEKTPKL